jgi:nicotinate-nucleotide adenylyltransferase
MSRDPERAPTTSSRVGLFGGTFDPPHRGHLSVADDVRRALELDRVLWITAGRPPHKLDRELTPAPLRAAMVRALIDGRTGHEASEIELERPGPSYTVDTVRRLHAALPGADLFLIIGADEFAALESWKDTAELLESVTLVVMDRDGDLASSVIPAVPGAARARFVPVRRVDLSSTGVRDRVAEGASIEAMVPPAVAGIIEREGLYR